MYKIIIQLAIVLASVLCIFPCNADTTCKISQNGDTVEVQDAVLESDSKVLVTLDNDSNNIAANVSVTIEVDYGGGCKKQYTDKTKVLPLQTALLYISIDSSYGGRSPKTVNVISITGTKCL